VRNITFPTLMTSERLATGQPAAAAAAALAIRETQAALRADIGLATRVGRALFPAYEAGLVTEVVARDLPYYDAAISPDVLRSIEEFVAGLVTP
jgi:hypothetical protein